MEPPTFSNILPLIFFCIILFLLLKKLRTPKTSNTIHLPPSPWKLPFIGNIHHLLGGHPHRKLRDLSNKYGPLLHLQLGEINQIIITSSELARKVMKTHDINFASRPEFLATKILYYNSSDIGFSPYGKYWSQLRKICTVELLSAKRVESFSFIRKEEGDNLVDKIRMAMGSPVNLTEMFLSLAYSTVSRAAFGKECTQQKKFLNAMKEAFKLLSGFSIVDFYPSWGFIGELMGLRARLERVHQHLDEILEEILEEHQAKNLRGDGIGEDIVDVLLRLANNGELDISLTTDNIKAVILVSNSSLTLPKKGAISGEPPLSKDNSGVRRPHKGVVLDDGASSVTSDSLTVLHKKFHFPNSLVATVPKRSDRASHPPPGYIVVYETHLRAGLRFPPPPELIDIVARCGVSIARFSHLAMSVTIGLIALFRDRGVVLTPECISRMGRFISDAQGRVTFRSKWLDICTRDPLKSWASAFFFVKNDWGLIEKWGKLTDLPAPLHIGEEDIMRILKVPDIEHLLYEVHYLGRYIEKEFLFKVGLSIHAGRSEAKMLKKSTKAPELPASAPVPVPKVAPKRPVGGSDPQSMKKKRMEGVATSADKAPSSSSPTRMHIPEDVLNHQCIGRRRADDLLLRRKELEAELTHSLNEWNNEFVKIKYLQGEYKRKYDSRTKEVKVLEAELSECRTELANIVRSVSLQNQQIDRLQVDLEGAQAVITQLRKDQKASGEKVGKLEVENKRSRSLLAEKEAALSGLESSRIIEDFKNSIAFKSLIQDHVQEARDHIYDIEVKALELQCIDEGFIRGFLKGVRLMQRKTGVIVDGLTPSQASGDPSSDVDGDEVESELQKVFDLEVDDDVVNIE
ncbi:hypothetical protein M5K25_019406 [Dendrobium thyrsiflorum]|uniref:Uncharacterized protein n=1 Tax=Dendrobium thyrsiflorum TaxID=117978 RepID=A0ABD0UER0_DENTH